jgi:hypothetical protein
LTAAGTSATTVGSAAALDEPVDDVEAGVELDAVLELDELLLPQAPTATAHISASETARQLLHVSILLLVVRPGVRLGHRRICVRAPELGIVNRV